MMNGYHDLLFYYPELVNRNSQGNPLQGYVKGQIICISTRIIQILIRFMWYAWGDNCASHGHLDAGSFYVQANGECIFYR